MTFRTMLLNLDGIIAVILPAGFFSADIFKPEFEEYDFGYLSMIVAQR